MPKKKIKVQMDINKYGFNYEKEQFLSGEKETMNAILDEIVLQANMANMLVQS
jgi:hypothetical protein